MNNFLSNLSRLIDPQIQATDDVHTQTLNVLKMLNYSTEKLMFELMQPCSTMLDKCYWLGKSVSCDTIFRVAKASEGFCCSFNYNALRDNFEG